MLKESRAQRANRNSQGGAKRNSGKILQMCFETVRIAALRHSD